MMKCHIIHTIRHETERGAPDDAFMYESSRADNWVTRCTSDCNMHVRAGCSFHAVISREEKTRVAHTGEYVIKR